MAWAWIIGSSITIALKIFLCLHRSFYSQKQLYSVIFRIEIIVSHFVGAASWHPLNYWLKIICDGPLYQDLIVGGPRWSSEHATYAQNSPTNIHKISVAARDVVVGEMMENHAVHWKKPSTPLPFPSIQKCLQCPWYCWSLLLWTMCNQYFLERPWVAFKFPS